MSDTEMMAEAIESEPMPEATYQVPAYDPANPISGPADIHAAWQIVETDSGPIALCGLRTSNVTYTLSFDTPEELEEFISHARQVLTQYRIDWLKKQLEAKKSALIVPGGKRTGSGLVLP